MSSRAQTSPTTSDEELVRCFQETGDNQCFAELFARHRKKIYFGCRGFFSDPAAAEDATQEAFLRAYQNMHRFQGGDFPAWLARIARNVCIDLWRKRPPAAGTEEMEPSELLPSGTPGQDSDLRLAIAKLRQEMQSLSPPQRQCLELKIDGYSYEETAVRMGLSVEAVKSHLQNGRRMLWLRMEGVLTRLR